MVVSTNDTTPSSSSGYPLVTRIMLGMLLIVIIAVASCGNGLMCLLIYRHPAMRSAVNLLLASLALSDSLLGMLCMPTDLVVLLTNDTWVPGGVLCRMQSFVFLLLNGAGTAALLLIGVDRYFLLVRRRDRLSSSTATLLLGVGWSLAALLALPLLCGWPGFLPVAGQTRAQVRFASTTPEVVYVVMLFLLEWLLPTVALLICHVLVLARVRRTVSRVDRFPLDGSMPDSVSCRTFVAVDVRRKTRTLATVQLLTAAFWVCRIPYVLTVFVWNLTACPPGPATPYLLCCMYVGSALDPLVYACRMRGFRVACLRALPPFCRRRLSWVWRMRIRSMPSTIYSPSEELYRHDGLSLQ